MKYVKLLLVSVAASLVFSCQTAQVYDGMATLGFDEDTVKAYFPNGEDDVNRIPITFTGTSNLWPIEVKVEIVADYSGDGFPAVENEDYLITSLDVFFGEPSEYADSLKANPNYKTSVTKYIEFTYPEEVKTLKDEIRVKLRIVSCTPDSEELKLTTKECVVCTSIHDVERIAGIYDVTGDLYTMNVEQGPQIGEDEYGNPIYQMDTTFVSNGSTGTWPVRISASDDGTSLEVRGLFCEAYDPVTDVNSGDRLDGYFVTEFKIAIDEETRTTSMTLGTANSSINMENAYFYCPEVLTSTGTFLEGPLEGYYDSTYSVLTFGSEISDNNFMIWQYSDIVTVIGPLRKASFLHNLRFERRSE